MDNIIQMIDVEKYYDDFHVLKNINFNVKRGEIVVICGPSGSGKSTLIRCINRLEEIDSGEIIIDGINIYDKKININRLRAETGMLFQHFNLFPHLTILRKYLHSSNQSQKYPKKRLMRFQLLK